MRLLVHSQACSSKKNKEIKNLTQKCTRLVLPPSTYPRMRNILCGVVVSWQKSKGWGKRILTTRLPTNDPFYRYIYPPTLRSKMAQLWCLTELRHWWLPNDEGYPPIVRSIRAFIEDRTQPRAQAQSEDVRNMRAIFSKMSIQSQPKSAIDTASQGTNGSGDGFELDMSKTAQLLFPHDIQSIQSNVQIDHTESNPSFQ